MRGAPYAPPPIEEVVAKIRETPPEAVFAPHVETSAGIILPDDYIAQMAAAAHEVGALMVLDCIAIGLHLGGYGGDRGRCADLGAAEGLVGVALGRGGGAVARGPRRGWPRRRRTALRWT